MKERELVQYCIDAFEKAGVPKAQCLLHNSEKHELNVATGEISLLRTTYDSTLHLTGLVDEKKGSISLNALDQESIDRAVNDVVALAHASKADSAYDIAEQQPPQEFHHGPEAPDMDVMHQRLTDYLAYSKATYPRVIQEETIFDFTRHHHYFGNSNGVDFISHHGNYNFITMFTAKEGKQSSSFNYSGFSSLDLDKELQASGSIDTLLRQSSEQITTTPLADKFDGEIIITPDCLGEFVEFVTGFLGDRAMISGNSIFKNKLNQAIAAEHFTLHSRPVSDEIAAGYFFTDDGYTAENSTIINRGLLNSFLLSLYGARKTGKSRAVNDGGAYVVEPGEATFDQMVRSVRKGILLCRFSGGYPGENGDFSGVAKNSYYIENGEIQYPLSETMISGNLAAALHTIRHISRERIDFGSAIFPWVQISNITISGK